MLVGMSLVCLQIGLKWQTDGLVLCPLFRGLGYRKIHGGGVVFNPRDFQRRGNLQEHGEQQSLFPGKKIKAGKMMMQR